MTPVTPAAVALSYLMAQAEAEAERQREVLKARRYDEGDHPTYLTDRVKEFLQVDGDDETFRLNYARGVVTAVAERLRAEGFSCADEAVEKAVAEWFDKASLAAAQIEIYEDALRDGEVYLLIEWDAEENQPVFTVHQTYTDPEVDGDGEGCRARYANDDPGQPMLYVSKRWTEDLGEGQARRRMTLYYPERVEKYVYVAGAEGQWGWLPFSDEDDGVWPLPWVDGAGTPLGIAAIHFPNVRQRPEAREAWPPQNIVNKLVIDLLSGSDMAGFRILVTRGFVPTNDGQAPASDGSNLLDISPGSTLSDTHSATETAVDAIGGEDPTPLANLVDRAISWLASTNDTPVTRLRAQQQVASAESQQETDAPLVSKVERRQALFGAAWSRAWRLVVRLANTYGGAGLAEDQVVRARWRSAVVRSAQEVREDLKAKRAMGVPYEKLWAEMGYSADEIEEMKRTSPEYRVLSFADYPGNGA